MARGVNATQTRMFVAPTVARRGESIPSPDPNINSTPYTIPSNTAEDGPPNQTTKLTNRVPRVSADFVQELYLKELKAYKTPAIKPADADAHVQVFTPPQTPASPEEADLASSLKEYEDMAVDVEGSEAAAAGAGEQQAAARDWLEEEEEA